MQILETPRLIVGPLTLDDAEALHHILDVELHWNGIVTLEERRERLRAQIAAYGWYEGLPAGPYGIALRDERQLIGQCHFRPGRLDPGGRRLLGLDYGQPDAHHHSLELHVGYALSPRHQGHGYATEAVRALITYLFREVDVPRVIIHTDQSNLRSVALMCRLGMQPCPAPQPGWPGRILGVLHNPADEGSVLDAASSQG